MYRSSPVGSTLNTNVSTYFSKNCFVLSKNEHFSPPAGSARFVHTTKTAGLREFTMCPNNENRADICKPWATYILGLFLLLVSCGTASHPLVSRILSLLVSFLIGSGWAGMRGFVLLGSYMFVALATCLSVGQLRHIFLSVLLPEMLTTFAYQVIWRRHRPVQRSPALLTAAFRHG